MSCTFFNLYIIIHNICRFPCIYIYYGDCPELTLILGTHLTGSVVIPDQTPVESL